MGRQVNQMRSDWLAFLRLDQCRLELSSKLTLRGAHLVSFTAGFQRLTELVPYRFPSIRSFKDD